MAKKKYRCKLSFLYTDIVHVEADNEDEAEKLALKDCHEEYDTYYDAKITEEE